MTGEDGDTIIMNIPGGPGAEDRAMATIQEVLDEGILTHEGNWRVKISHNEDCAAKPTRKEEDCDCDFVLAVAYPMDAVQSIIVESQGQYDSVRDMN